MCDDKQARMPEGSEFQADGAMTLKLWVAKVVQTQGTDGRLMLAEHRECAGMC